MNPNSNPRCGCFCRPQIPAPPCMNTDCGCDHYHSCNPCDDRLMPPPAQIPPMPQTRPPMPPIQPPASQVSSAASQTPSTPAVSQTPSAPAMSQTPPAPAMSQTSSASVISGGCGCGNGSPLFPNANINQMPVGMGYVPWQRWGQTYPMEQGFVRGTLFPELDLPFVMGRCR